MIVELMMMMMIIIIATATTELPKRVLCILSYIEN